MSTLKTTNLQNASAASAAIVLAADGSATANLSSVNGGPIAGSRNRIINGDMRIDQRNAGASLSYAASDQKYSLDRWEGMNATDGTFTIQQSSTAPPNFVNSLLFTVTSADSSLGTSQYAAINQRIEGFNAADLGWGTATAQTITLSFWVRSSLTGTFGGALSNSATNRSYPFTYTVLAANTWEQKAVIVAGDTSGTWLTNNGIGVRVYFGLGVGTSVAGTAGSWAGVEYRSATGGTNVMATNGATFYITGVQLEPGSTATPFERRSYGQELMLAQRYYQRVEIHGATLAGANTTKANGTVYFPTVMRANPTVTGDAVNRMTNFGVTDYSGTYTFSVELSKVNLAAIVYAQSSGGTWSAGLPLAISPTGNTASLYATAEL